MGYITQCVAADITANQGRGSLPREKTLSLFKMASKCLERAEEMYDSAREEGRGLEEPVGMASSAPPSLPMQAIRPSHRRYDSILRHFHLDSCLLFCCECVCITYSLLHIFIATPSLHCLVAQLPPSLPPPSQFPPPPFHKHRAYHLAPLSLPQPLQTGIYYNAGPPTYIGKKHTSVTSCFPRTMYRQW